MAKSNILILIGMHRSGTSLLANWLSKCGVSMGDNMLGVDEAGNKDGHFEDIDFLRLHRDIIYKNGFHDYLIESGTLKFEKYHTEKAKSLIEFKSRLHQIWGWKDPRTCLLLSLWNEVLQLATRIVVFRHYAEVAHSLNKRRIKKYKDQLKTASIYRRLWAFIQLVGYYFRNNDDLYVKVWSHYNREILKNIKLDNKTAFLSNKSILKYDKQILKWLVDQGCDIEPIGIHSIYKGSYTSSERVKLKTNSNVISEAEKVLKELLIYEKEFLNKLDRV